MVNYGVGFLIFGRPFVTRFALCYQTVVCPVRDVGVLWPNDWMDQDETWQAGRPWPWPHCVTWGLSSPPQRDTATPQFSAHICCGQMAGWIKMPLGKEVGLVPSDIVLDGDPALPPQKKGQSPLPSFWSMSIEAKRLGGSRWHLAWR